MGDRLSAGTVMAERYVLRQVIGTGSYGYVWTAEDKRVGGREVAIKVLRKELAATEEVSTRFRGEALALSKLRHPNIVTLLDQGEWEGQQFLVLEYLPGQSLEMWLQDHHLRGKRPELLDVSNIFDQICAGVAAAHETTVPGPIVHRDLKPSNVLISRQGTEWVVKVTDFGIAQVGTRDRTRTGMVMGTPTYMAPEQGLGHASSVGTWTDVFSLGVILIEMLTGCSNAGAPEETWWAWVVTHHDALLSKLEGLRTDIPKTVWSVLNKAMQLRWSMRYRTARDLRVAFNEAMANPVMQNSGVALIELTLPRSIAPLFKENKTGELVLALHDVPATRVRPQLPTLRAGHAVSENPANLTDEATLLPDEATLPLARLSEDRGVDPTIQWEPIQVPGHQPSSAKSKSPNPVQSSRSMRALVATIGLFIGAASIRAIVGGKNLQTRRLIDASVTGNSASECERGSVRACMETGRSYENGSDGAVDFQHAAFFFERACLGGEPSACARVGSFHERGEGMPQDFVRARRMYQLACDGGDLTGCNSLGWMYQHGQGVSRDYSVALSYFRRACDGNNLAGCNNLGWLYGNGVGVALDYSRAVSLFLRACDGGNLSACNNLGLAYERGQGVTSNNERAFSLYDRACQGHELSGCTNLGRLLHEGQGVAHDGVRAMALFQRACEGGELGGCVYRGLLCELGTAGRKDFECARNMYQRVCDGGLPIGCYRLANLYRSGAGVRRDVVRARNLYALACDGGVQQACGD
jgi:TPR repeat protein/serine/threonine protein kinase